jgi:hypothetical protein
MPTKWADCTEERKQRMLEYNREYRRRKSANETEEEKQNRRENDRNRRANWTEERKQSVKNSACKWRAKMTEEQKEQDRRRRGVRAARYRAKKHRVPFNLTLDYINEIWPPDNKCPVFGFPFVRGRVDMILTSPALDRIEPDKGYTIGNVQVISARANLIKTDATAAEVMIVAQYLIKEERKRAST